MKCLLINIQVVFILNIPRKGIKFFFVKMFYTGLKYLPMYFTLSAGFVSHLLLFICLLKDPLKCFRNSATYLIANLALSDFITCSAGLIRMTLAWKISLTTVFYIWDTASFVSLLSIFSIAVDRYVLTVHPFKHRVLLNGRRIAIWILSLWLLSSWLVVKDLTFGTSQIDTQIYDTIFIVISLVTGLIYVNTYLSLRKQRRGISEQNQSRRRPLQEEFLKTILIVAVIQILTLVPLSSFSLVHGWSIDFNNSVSKLVVYSMYCINIAINPFLYIWRLRNYRQAFRLVFCTKLC